MATFLVQHFFFFLQITLMFTLHRHIQAQLNLAQQIYRAESKKFMIEQLTE